MGMAMPVNAQAAAPIEIPARVIVWSALLMRCLIKGREIDLSSQMILPGTTVRQSGDEGIVVVPTWYAINLDLA